MNINSLVPGTVEIPGRRSLYMQIPNGKDGEHVYEIVSDWIKECNKNGNAPNSGAIVYDECHIHCPDGSLFTALSFRGDLEGWTNVLRLFAEKQSLLIGLIEGHKFRMNDGRFFDLSACRIIHS